jgi:hypothetical protein
MMSNSNKISLKSFIETVEERLDSFTPQQLRSILMDMAMQVPSLERQAFLDKLITPEVEVAEEVISVHQEDLLNDIVAFIEDLEDEMLRSEYEPSWHYEYYDDEDSLGPYEDYVSEIEEFFDKANAAFDYGNLELSKDVYKRLFGIFEIQDDYGRGVSAYDLNNIDMKEAAARYLRSVYETASTESRPQLIFDEMLHVPSRIAERQIGLEDLIQISTESLPDKEQFLNDWISFLRTQEHRAADYWLREAVRIARGIEGLKELALSDGKKHLRAFLDWIAALINEGKYREVIAAVESAREAISPDMPIRAAIADYLKQAAEQVGDEEIESAARWEAFYAKPELSRLLELWESTPDESQRVKLMRRASERIKEYLRKRLPAYSPFASFDHDAAESYAPATKSNLAHAYLLCKGWESAYDISRTQKELGWSSSDNPQGLVAICFLGLASGKMPSDFPPNLALLWNQALKNSLYYDAEETILLRLKEAYEAMFSNASLAEAEEKFLRWCLNISRKRANSIVQNQFRKSYWKAATLITACAEVLKLRGEEREVQAMIDEIRNKFPRHRSFQAELREAIAR